MNDLKYFKFWCQSILPLVYDDSLSYYEVLCKVVKYINDLIASDREIVAHVDELEAELGIVQKWIKDFDTNYAEKIISQHLATMIFVGIDNGGYIRYYIPESWDDIKFHTTGLDIEIEPYGYGRLVLSY